MLDGETDWFEHKKFGRAFPVGRLRVRTDWQMLTQPRYMYTAQG